MSSLEERVSRGIRSIAKEGVDANLIQMCRRRTAKFDKSRNWWNRLFKGSDGDKADYAYKIPEHIEAYKSNWNLIESLSGELDYSNSLDFKHLNVLVESFKTQTSLLVNYTHPNRFARSTYHINRKISRMYSRIPLWGKLLIELLPI